MNQGPAASRNIGKLWGDLMKNASNLLNEDDH